MADKTLFNRLKRLFSTNVIIRNLGGKELRVTDTERIQSYSDLNTNFLKSRGMAGFHSTVGRYGYNELATISMQRLVLFRDYDLMETDPIIACLHKNTKVSTLAGFFTIEELSKKYPSGENFEVWSWDRDTCKYTIGHAHHPRKTGTKNVIKLVFDNGKYLKCTSDHRIMLIDGTYKEAGQLIKGDSVMPFYYKNNEYMMISDRHGKYKKAHKYIYEDVYNKDINDKHIHHINHNKYDNSTQNLIEMFPEEHMKYHGISNVTSDRKSIGWTDEMKLNASNRMKELWKNESNKDIFLSGFNEFKNRHDFKKLKSEYTKTIWKNSSKIERDAMLIGLRKWQASDDGKKFMSEHTSKLNKNRWENDTEYAKKMSKIFSNKLKELWKDKEWSEYKRKLHSETMKLKYANDLEYVNKTKHIGETNGKFNSNITNEYILSEGIKYDTITEFAKNINLESINNKVQFINRRLKSIGYNSFFDYKNNYVYANHKIIDIIDEGEVSDVYDLTVDFFENFALESGIIVSNSALDIYADESCVRNEFGDILTIKTDDDKIKDVLHNLFYDILNIEFNIWPWMRTLPIKWDTYIPLLSGENITIKELSDRLKEGKEEYVYSIHNKTNAIVPGKVIWCDKNISENKIVKIIFDDDSFVETAPSHPFILRDGTEIRADELKIDDSLMPFYRKLSDKNETYDLYNPPNYEMIYNISTNKYEYTHRIVAEKSSIKKNKNETILHHIDFNKYNNRPDNLLPMNWLEHKKLHASHCKKVLHSPEVTELRMKGIDKYLRSEKRREYLRTTMKGIYPKYFDEYNNSELHEEHNSIRSIKTKEQWANAEKRKQMMENMRGSHKNHKVKAIEIYDDMSDVYCMTVVGLNGEHDRHDFAICGKDSDGNITKNSGVFVKNCKYGDHFLKLEISEKYGIVNVIPASPYEITREEGFDPENPFRVKFKHEGLMAGQLEYENYEIAHFRLLGDTNFLPYGKSMIESGRRVWKQLQLMEDAMLIHRIMRAPEKRIFKIDTGNIPPNETEQFIKSVVNKIKKTPYIDPRTGEYNLKYNMMNMTEDFFIPVRGGDSGTNIESLPGLEYNAIDDIEYLRNKMMSALKIPKAFLGYEEGISGKATLAAEDVRFARTIERIQKIFVSELTKIAVIHLYSQGFKDDDIVNFELSLTNPSTIYEQEKIALWQEKVSLVRDMQEIKLLSNDWIYKNIINLAEDEIQSEKKKVLDDVKIMFRHSQIENEGNDPFLTNQTFGTSHDLALLQKGINSSDEKALDFGKTNFKFNWEDSLGKDEKITDDKDYDKDYNDEKREPSDSKYGQDSHIRGRDPLGKDINTPNKDVRKTKQNYLTNSVDMSNKMKTVKLIKESLKLKMQDDGDQKLSDEKEEKNYLDEENLLDL